MASYRLWVEKFKSCDTKPGTVVWIWKGRVYLYGTTGEIIRIDIQGHLKPPFDLILSRSVGFVYLVVSGKLMGIFNFALNTREFVIHYFILSNIVRYI